MGKWIFTGVCFVAALTFFVGCEEQQKSAVKTPQLQAEPMKPTAQQRVAEDKQYASPAQVQQKHAPSLDRGCAGDEDKIIGEIEAGGIGNRFAIADIKPTASAAGFHMSDESSQSGRGEVTFKGGGQSKPARGRATINEDRTISRETSDDRIPESIFTTDMKSVPCFGDGSIIRFSGRVEAKTLSFALSLPENAPLAKLNLAFVGEGAAGDRLTFLFSSKYGFVYVRGKGKVIHDGKETQLGQ